MSITKQEPRYEVFISYRRNTSDELALLLQRELQRKGLHVFLDRDLTRGVFDDNLFNRIAEAPTFLVIVTPNSLDRCSDEEDWVRKEIVHAISTQRNIIPLQDGFQFTAEMNRKLDPSVRELSRYQAVEYSRAYFDSMIERIVQIIEEDKAERAAAQEAQDAARKAEFARETRLIMERAEAERKERQGLDDERRAETAKQEAQRLTEQRQPIPPNMGSLGANWKLTVGAVIVATIGIAVFGWSLSFPSNPQVEPGPGSLRPLNTGTEETVDIRRLDGQKYNFSSSMSPSSARRNSAVIEALKHVRPLEASDEARR
ncbi:MAG TPA: TIR domain-containing protein [Candidatus Angelobacter sp.]|jgi:hypothetical protein|nr:TIR domain-containing protein [Candidatus Angelobacter sp.]